MKTLILITAISTFLFYAGCSTTTYLSDKPINYDKQGGAELSVLLKDGTVISGELIHVMDDSLVVDSISIATSQITEVIIEGSNYVWAGVGIGAAVGIGAGLIIWSGVDSKSSYGSVASGGLLILLTPIIGGIVGYWVSDEEYILQNIPESYNYDLLKPFARHKN